MPPLTLPLGIRLQIDLVPFSVLLVHHPRSFVLPLVEVCNCSLAMLAAFLEGADVVATIVPNLIAEAFNE